LKEYLRSDWILVVLFLTGVFLVVLDGYWFPFANMAGISLIALSSYLALSRGK
jgi:hypothetical protein